MILQDVVFSSTASVTVCPFTTYLVEAPLIRLPVMPTKQNGLSSASQLMVDKVTTVTKAELQKRVGKLTEGDMTRLSHAVLVFLGLSR